MFLLGVLVLCALPDLPARGWLWLAPLCVGLFSARWYISVPAWLLAGFLFAFLRATLVLAAQLPANLEGRTVVVTGAVASLPESRSGVLRFNFRLLDSADSGLPAGTLVRVGWYYTAPVLLPGERWRLRLRLRRPVGFMNAGGFDYEGWLFQRRVRATGYVTEGPGTLKLAEAGPWQVDFRRHRLREQIRAVLQGSRFEPLVIALALGDQSGIAQAQWSVMIRTGINHLLAISGLHIGIVAAAAWWLLLRIWARIPGAALAVPAPWVAAVLASMAAAIYCALAGFSIPTQRSLVMIVIGAGAHVLRPAGLGRALALAAIAVLVLDPFSVLAPGFWLSFLAVAWIGWGMQGHTGPASVWDRWGRVQWVVSLGLLPVLAFWFQQVSLSGLAANLVAIPWVSFVTVPLVLSGSLLVGVVPDLGAALLRLADGTLQLLWPFLSLLSDPALAVMDVGPVSGPATLWAAAGAALLLLPRGMPARWLGMVWMLPLLLPTSAGPPPGSLQLALLDVGQGLAAVVRTARHALLYDTGPVFGPEFNAGAAVVVPWLRHRGVKRLDTLIVSHGDADHIGGLAAVRDALPVTRILTSVPRRVGGPGVEMCRARQHWQWDGFDFAILHPAATDRLEGNDASCVLLVRGHGRALLLAGDVEQEGERRLVERFAAELHADIVVVPHHGSRTSSTPGFVSAVAPRFALYAAAFRNRFGFPKQDIMQRYQQHGATNLDTGRNGALEFLVDEAGVRYSSRRASARRFWHTRLQ